MIKSFAHKGLKKFWNTGGTAGIQHAHKTKLLLILQKLDDAVAVRDVNFHGADLHPLKGNLKDYWSVSVSGNWRVIFRFEGGNAYVVDYLDYH